MLVTQRPIGAARKQVRRERKTRAGEGARRRNAELGAVTGCRVEQVVGLVELDIGRQAGQLVTLGTHPWDVRQLGDICFFSQEGEPSRQPAVEAALDPGSGERAPAIIGDRRVVGDLGGRQEILINGQKIGTAEIRPERVDLLADLGGEP